MHRAEEKQMHEIAQTMAETETMWLKICGAVDEERVEWLVNAMIEQHALVMEGENNANAVMSLVGFISRQVIAMHEDGGISMEAAMVLLQIGMQRGVQAHIALKAKAEADA